MGKLNKPKSQVPGQGIPPELYEQIRTRYIRGETVWSIAAGLGLSYDKLVIYCSTVLRPELHKAGVRHCGELLAEIQMLRHFAWEQLVKTENGLTHVTEKEAYYAAAKGKRPKQEAKKLAGLVERVTKILPNNQAKGWAQIIQWCIEQEARIAGYYKQPADMASGGGLRVGGYTPDEINDKMLDRIHAIISKREEEARLRQQFISRN